MSDFSLNAEVLNDVSIDFKDFEELVQEVDIQENSPKLFELYLNRYAAKAGEIINCFIPEGSHPDMDKYRIPQGTAKQMLLYDEAPVYRLLPSGSEKIAPIAAVSTGLWYENYREFAIAPEDLGALDKLIRRETDRLTGNLPQLLKNEERRPAPER